MSDPDWDLSLSMYYRIRWYNVLRTPPLHVGHGDNRVPISLAGTGPPSTLRRLCRRQPRTSLHQLWYSGSPRRPNHPRQFLVIGLGVLILRGIDFCHFYRAACNADAVLRWEFCLSVCPSVCLSVTRVYCDKTEEKYVQIFTPYER